MTQRALELDASVRAKRGWPGGTHPFESFMDRAQIQARYYSPLSTLPIDYWMPYQDADDIESWLTIIMESLDPAMIHLISKGKLQGVLVPDIWPPTDH